MPDLNQAKIIKEIMQKILKHPQITFKIVDETPLDLKTIETRGRILTQFLLSL